MRMVAVQVGWNEDKAELLKKTRFSLRRVFVWLGMTPKAIPIHLRLARCLSDIGGAMNSLEHSMGKAILQ